MILEVIKNDALRQIEKERSVAASLRAYLPVSFFDLLSLCTSLCQCKLTIVLLSLWDQYYNIAPYFCATKCD